MTIVPWIPVSEQLPPERQTVIVCHGGAIFAGWLGPDRCWFEHLPEHPGGGQPLTVDRGDVRATDFWLTLPTEHPQHNAVRGGYPA